MICQFCQHKHAAHGKNGCHVEECPCFVSISDLTSPPPNNPQPTKRNRWGKR